MTKIIIEGQNKLSGTIEVSGAKNSVVALIPAALLSDNLAVIDNIPDITDTHALFEILDELNVPYRYKDTTLTIDTHLLENKVISKNLATKLRASYYFMGVLLAKFQHCEIFFPGGCKIGKRPIDYHLEGFKQLGVTINQKDGKYILDAKKLKGASITLPFASVGATINIMLAATRAKGKTVIKHAAKEPEIVNVANFLNSMGAKIEGAGTDTITILGVNNLRNGNVTVIPDRIEAGTYIIAGALIGDNLVIDKMEPQHLESLFTTLNQMGCEFLVEENSVVISKCNKLKSIDITSTVYPGFVTDLGQPIQALMTQANGISTFKETIYEKRMGHIPYLNKMGANIANTDNKAFITGPSKLIATTVSATDLRAGASLILASLVAEGTTTIENADYILRGYSKIMNKLTKVGAKIKIEE